LLLIKLNISKIQKHFGTVERKIRLKKTFSMEDSVSPQLNIGARAVRGYVWSPFGTPLKMMFTVLVLVLYKSIGGEADES
jgi:hypothetical protein